MHTQSVFIVILCIYIPAICTLCQPWESFIIGCVGVVLSYYTDILVYKLKVDDPVGVVPVHLVCGIWGLIAVGNYIVHPNI